MGLGRNFPFAPLSFFGGRGNSYNPNSKYIDSGIIPFLSDGCNVTLVGVHPRHSPRAFPLGLLAPRCLCVCFAHASWGEEVSSPRVGLLLEEITLEKFRPRHPHTTLCNIDYIVSLSLLDLCVLYNFGAHPLAMDATSGNARGGIHTHLTHPPIRVCTKPRSQGREECERDSLKLKTKPLP
jgi:hypothetical protein